MFLKRLYRVIFITVLIPLSIHMFGGASYAFQQDTIPSAASVKLTDEEKQWIIDHPVVTATNGQDFAPFDFVQFGQPTGFSIDYLKLVAEKTGLNIEFVNGYIWADLLNLVKNKEIDITHTLIKSPVREDYLAFTESYITLPLVYYGKNDAKLIHSPQDLNGKKVGIIKGTMRAKVYTSNYPDLEFVEFTSTPNALIALTNGEIDVFPSQSTVVDYLISKNLIFGLKIIGEQTLGDNDPNEAFRLATHKDNPILRNILDKGTRAVTELEYLNIAKKWQEIYLMDNTLKLSINERLWLEENNVIKVAADPTAFPVTFITDDNQIAGVAGNYLDLIAEKLDVRFEWIGNPDWSTGLAKVNSGEADMIAGIVSTPERENFFDITDNYLTISFVIYARDSGDIYANMDALNGKKIAQIKDYNMTENLREAYPNINIVEVNTTIEALELLSNGEVDAHVATIPSTSRHIASMGIKNVIVVGDTAFKSYVSFGIRKELSYLSSAIQKTMRSITEEEKTEINKKWLSVAIQKESDYRLLIMVSAVLVVVMLIIFIWANSLRREVRHRLLIESDLKRANEKALKLQFEAEKANEAKSRFLANMSHEIRTPLNAIIGFSEIITSGILGEDKKDKHNEYLEDIKNSGQHLSSVVNDILDLSKIEAGKWELQESEFLLEKCITDASKIVNPLADEKNISISVHCDQPIKIKAELYALKRAVINLLSNAIKFTNENGEIDCKIFISGVDTVIIEIKDNGIGIDPDKLEYVLTPFGQNHEIKNNNQIGTGLGLPIVKQLIELHSGMFTLKSEVEIGTIATIELPQSRVVH